MVDYMEKYDCKEAFKNRKHESFERLFFLLSSNVHAPNNRQRGKRSTFFLPAWEGGGVREGEGPGGSVFRGKEGRYTSKTRNAAAMHLKLCTAHLSPCSLSLCSQRWCSRPSPAPPIKPPPALHTLNKRGGCVKVKVISPGPAAISRRPL